MLDKERHEGEVDCRYFKGDEPCIYFKKDGSRCKCEHFDKVSHRILIIKLGELGDVIRTTPVLHPLKKNYPNSYITWLTKTPKFLPSIVDEKLKFNHKNVLRLQGQEFDLLLNFDKEKESCALANLINAKVKKGFGLKHGKAHPIDEDALFKFKIGLDDEFNLQSKKSYPEQVFEIAGLKYNNEKYIFDNDYKKGKKLIGFNTGCGTRWSTRLWPEQNWIDLAKMLIKDGYSVILLGGETEHAKNTRIAKESGALYLGYYPLKTFVALINFCDTIVTSVTMALHVAIALEKNIILFNNVFNKNEFELYGLGKILEPDVDCLGCYRTECSKPNCMARITPDIVFSAIEEIHKQKGL